MYGAIKPGLREFLRLSGGQPKATVKIDSEDLWFMRLIGHRPRVRNMVRASPMAGPGDRPRHLSLVGRECGIQKPPLPILISQLRMAIDHVRHQQQVST